jgi:hypothetical protein
MATARKAVAVTTFVAITEEDGYRVVVEGEELDATDELVKANRSTSRRRSEPPRARYFSQTREAVGQDRADER